MDPGVITNYIWTLFYLTSEIYYAVNLRDFFLSLAIWVQIPHQIEGTIHIFGDFPSPE